LCGFDLRVRLCRVDAHVAEHGPYRFEVVLLLEDPDREIREKATFWLGQSRDPRAAKYLEDRISK